MAQIIRKLEKGDKIKKYQNGADKLDFSASAITGNSNNSNSNSGTTDFSKQSMSGNSQSQNLDFSANSIIGKPKVETPKTIIFKKNGWDTNWTIDDVKNMMVKVQDRTLANKQLNTKESTKANNWLLQQIQNAKESVDITNKGIYIDGVPVTTPETFYERYGLLRKEQSKNYAGDLLAREAGVILENSNTENRYSPFDLPGLNITVPAELISNGEVVEEEKTADQLAIDEFNKTHKTTGNYQLVRFKDPSDKKWKNYYVFNRGGGNYYLATKDANGNYVKINDDLSHLIYDDQTNSNFGKVYTGIGGTYRLIDKDILNNESSEYQSAFNEIVNPLVNSFTTILTNIKDQFNNKSAYYNPHVSQEKKPYVNVSNVFSKIGTSDISDIYIDLDTNKTHFGQFDIPSVESAIIVKNGDPIKVNIHQNEDGTYYAEDDAHNKYELGNLSTTQTIKKDPYTEINFDYYRDADNQAIGKDDVFNWAGDFRVEDSDDWDRNDDDEFVNYDGAVDAIKRTVDKLIQSPAYYSNFSKDLEANFNGLVDFTKKYEEKHGQNNNFYRLRYEVQRLYNYIKDKQAAQQVPVQKKGGKLRIYQSGGFTEWLKNESETKHKNYYQTTSPELLYNNKKGKEHATLDNEWEWTDWARGVAVGADAAALAGGYVGLGAGIVATVLEGVADITEAIDGQVEWGDALKNLGINLGFTLLSILPGAGSLKAVKTGIKGGAKLVKSLGKLEDVANVARKVGKADDANVILKAADEALDIKDIKNIITSSENILKNQKIVGKLSKTQIDEAASLLETCQKAIKLQEKANFSAKTIGTVGRAINAGMTAYGLQAGANAVGNITTKIVEGNGSDINLNDIHGLVAGVAGIKGARNIFKRYATRKALVDKTQTSSDVNVPLKHGDIEINIKSKGKSSSKVKEALQSEIQALKVKQSKLQSQVNSATGQDRVNLTSELDQINQKIRDYETIESNFKTAYDGKWTNTVQDVGATINNKWNSFVEGFKKPDYSKKRLIDDSDDLNWIQRKGREYAKQEGFTEDGFTIADYQIPKGYYTKRLKLDKVKNEIQTNKVETLVGKAIQKVTKSKSKSGKPIEKALSELKGESFNSTQKDKLIEAIKNNESFTDKDRLIEIVKSLKKGGAVNTKSVKKYNRGNAFNSVQDPTTDPELDPKADPKLDITIPYRATPNNTSAKINKKATLLGSLGIVPEAMSIAAKTINATVATNKANDILQNKEAVKLQAPYLHLPVQEDLASYQYQKDAINEGRAHLNKNQTSDASLQQAVNLEYTRSANDSIGKLNALRSQKLEDSRLRSFNQEFDNEKSRIDVNNKNNTIDGNLADYKQGLEANRILNLAQIGNANLDQNWVLLNQMMNSANARQLAKYKNDLTQDYYNQTDWNNEYLTKYDSYEKSPMVKYQAALGINKDQIVTQEQADSLYAKYLEQNPKLTEQQKNSIKLSLNAMVGKTLQQYYEEAYKWHENNIVNAGRKYQSDMTMADANAEASKYFITAKTFNQVPFAFKKGGSFTETKYKTDAKSKDQHKKLALEYAKLMHKQHQEAIKNSLPFLLHSYKNTTKA